MGIQTALDSISNNAGSPYGFKNRIINGAMVIDQRNAGASVTPADGAFVTDRWKFGVSQSSKFTSQQSTTAASGFSNSLLITSSSSYSIVSGDYFNVQQRIEGFNTADLAWGTSTAATVTLSFWVRSSLTGTFGGALSNNASNRSYPFTYTISSANTWEQKFVTIPGDTTGTWATNNSIGILVSFGFGVGSTYSGTAGSWAGAYYLSATGAASVVGTNAATFYITGVQLEKGSTATAFDYRPYGAELQLCQRYYVNVMSGGSAIATGFMWNVSELGSIVSVPVTMRTSPSLVQTTGTAYYAFERAAGNQTFSSFLNIVRWASQQGYLYTSSSGTTGHVGELRGNNGASYVAFSSEL